MTSRHRALLALTAVAALAAGCTRPGPAEKTALPGAPAAGAAVAAASASPSPTGPDARQRLLTALEKTKKASYRFSVSGDVVDNKKITGSGAYDPKAKRITTTKKLTGGSTEQSQVIVVGTDFFSREKNGETWVHLNLKRVKKNGLYYYDMTDPTGLSRFVSSVATVRSTGPTTFSGSLDIKGDKFNDGFLPVGTPAISVWFGGDAQFSATTDAKGWVTSIGVSLRDKNKTLRMTTRLTGHGAASGITKPSNYGEAMDIYYQ